MIEHQWNDSEYHTADHRVWVMTDFRDIPDRIFDPDIQDRGTNGGSAGADVIECGQTQTSLKSHDSNPQSPLVTWLSDPVYTFN